jgi:hypothetical protein
MIQSLSEPPECRVQTLSELERFDGSPFWCLTADCCCLTKTLSPKAPMSTHVLCSRMPYVDGYITALYCIANLPSNKPNPPIPETHWNTSNRLPLGPSDQTAPLSTNQSRVSRPNSGSPGLLVAPLVTTRPLHGGQGKVKQATRSLCICRAIRFRHEKSLVAALADRTDAKLITHVQVCLALSG